MDNQKPRDFFQHAFANRLCTALKEKGQTSNTATSGVKVSALANAARCSNQMARRYTLGEALPDYKTVLYIANWLGVSPGWLLFGSDGYLTPVSQADGELIGIGYKRLQYILQQAAPLLKTSVDMQEVVDFMMDIIYDAAHLSSDDAMAKKMIDLAINSASRFQKKSTTDMQKEMPRDPQQATVTTT